MDVLDVRPEPSVEFVIRRGERAEELRRAGPVETTTASRLPSGFCWSHAACVVSPMRSFISSNSALRAPFVSAAQDFQVSSSPA